MLLTGLRDVQILATRECSNKALLLPISSPRRCLASSARTDADKIAILGGGITGLASAY